MILKKKIRSLTEHLLELPLAGRLLAGRGEQRLIVLMLHRFSSSDGSANNTANRLTEILQRLNTEGIPVMDIDAGVACLTNGSPFPNNSRLAVCFTVDDGYQDFATIGWPVFRQYSAPVSLFVVPGLIDGDDWFWWDKIEWLSRQAEIDHLPLSDVGLSEASLSLTGSRPLSRKMLVEAAKTLPAPQVHQLIEKISALIGIPVPRYSPQEFKLLSWNELHRLAQDGVKIGAHSMTHPIIGRCDDKMALFELRESVARVRKEFATPCLSFCFPNGGPGDFTERDLSILEDLRVPFALTTDPQIMYRGNRTTLNSTRIVTVPRIAFGDRLGYLYWLARN